MNIFENIRKEALKGLKPITFFGQEIYLRKLQPEDLYEGFNVSLRITRNSMSEMEHLKDTDPTGSIMDTIRGETGEDEDAREKAQSGLEFFGIDAAKNRFDELLNARALIKFTSVQYVMMMVDSSGKQIANTDDEINQLAGFLAGNPEKMKEIQEANKEAAEGGN